MSARLFSLLQYKGLLTKTHAQACTHFIPGKSMHSGICNFPRCFAVLPIGWARWQPGRREARAFRPPFHSPCLLSFPSFIDLCLFVFLFVVVTMYAKVMSVRAAHSSVFDMFDMNTSTVRDASVTYQELTMQTTNLQLYICFSSLVLSFSVYSGLDHILFPTLDHPVLHMWLKNQSFYRVPIKFYQVWKLLLLFVWYHTNYF